MRAIASSRIARGAVRVVIGAGLGLALVAAVVATVLFPPRSAA